MSIDRVPSSQDRQQVLDDEEQDVMNHDQADNRHLESSRKRIFVLLGSSVLQLPIWGMACFL